MSFTITAVKELTTPATVKQKFRAGNVEFGNFGSRMQVIPKTNVSPNLSIQTAADEPRRRLAQQAERNRLVSNTRNE